MYQKIKALCEEHGTNITALERNVGLGYATIAKWKTSSPTVDKLKRVADYFKVSVDYLISDESEPDRKAV